MGERSCNATMRLNPTRPPMSPIHLAADVGNVEVLATMLDAMVLDAGRISRGQVCH